ncbi:MAG TPA: single-stranded-DNA-specific exonuclease RecJ [Acidobacteriota bacterium]|nr:single-stranded-DNA-specific exonuclease RecJ [Acidobacteriota bacterium]
METRWDVASLEPAKTEFLCTELGISPLLARLLINRGVGTPEEAGAFLNGDIRRLHNPFLMEGMKAAVARIFEAVEQDQKILVYGDYDVDGITATAVLRRALEMLGGCVDHYIPRRLEDGYGLRKEVIERAKESGRKLILTVDSGIRDFEACRRARELGLDLIVTDHHLPADRLPEAFAVLNPKQSGCSYPDKDLAAVGVAFKLVDALFREAGRAEAVPHFLKLVAIGTIADMVPMRGENRILVKAGLEGLSQPYNLGLQGLLQGAGVSRKVSTFDIAFKVAPRINAFTRMGGSGEAVDLFSLDDPEQVTALVAEMNRRNTLRRAEEERILREIEERVAAQDPAFGRDFLLLAGKGWHRGVIGNVAARVVEKFHRPALIVSLSSERCQGSGRSIPGFHLLKALETCDASFSAYGGHAQAVGCTLSSKQATQPELEALAEALAEYASVTIQPEMRAPSVRIDAILDLEEVTYELCDEMGRLAPHGIGNPEPILASRQVEVVGGPWVLKERHLKLRARRNGSHLDAIWWRRGDVAAKVRPGHKVDLAYSLSRECFRGQDNLLLTVQDLVPVASSGPVAAK